LEILVKAYSLLLELFLMKNILILLLILLILKISINF